MHGHSYSSIVPSPRILNAGVFSNLRTKGYTIALPQQPHPRFAFFRRRWIFALAITTGLTLLTFLALAVHGYHPYAEDGGVYMAGIKRMLYPSLYAASAPFVEAHLRFSLFAPAVAGLVGVSHLSLATVLLLLHLVSLWTTLVAVWLIATYCFEACAARAGAVLLMACTLTVPVAGTSLILMDPYVTARSISLPCTLFALAGTMAMLREAGSRDRIQGAALCGISLPVAGLMHPLMAGYGLASVLLLWCVMSPSQTLRRWGIPVLCLLALVVATTVERTAAPEPDGYLAIALSRYYWFLSRWHWYEIAGLIAPLGILGMAARRSSIDSAMRPLTRMAVTAGSLALSIALLFAHADASTHPIARLQPLRIFQLVYVVMILVLGGLLGERILKSYLWRWLAAAAFFGTLFFAVQRDTYPYSAHIEWPGSRPKNHWEQSFVWISRNTPIDALFALDADYTANHGEDAQCFRALAERSALPDYSKDGGEASITPSLTPLWVIGQQAQRDLSRRSDAERLAALRPLNVTWVVLQREAKTGFDCPFRNDAVLVCRLP